MRCTSLNDVLARIAVVFAAPILISSNIFAQSLTPQIAQASSFQEKLQQVTSDKADFVAKLVSKWEDAARAAGKWDANYTTDMQAALMKLQPTNLVAAADATSFTAFQRIIRNGAIIPNAAMVLKSNGDSASTSPVSDAGLGDFADNLVYNPINPCRIVDTRNAGGKIAGGTSRSFDVDNTTSFTFQGGNNGPCGIPFNVASAVEMTITATNEAGVGYLTAWSVGASQPLASVLDYYANTNIADTVIVPVLPGPGNDFNIFSSATSDVVVDILGYFAAPNATPLNCTQVATGYVSVPVDVWTVITATCPTGFSATGGGWFTNEGSLGYPGVWLLSVPNGSTAWSTYVDNQDNGPRNIATYAQCCQIPGR